MFTSVILVEWLLYFRDVFLKDTMTMVQLILLLLLEIVLL